MSFSKSLKPFFRIRESFFQSFRTKFLSLLYMISLAYKISHCLSANHYPELRCVICTFCTGALLSANQNRVIFFMCIITGLIVWMFNYGVVFKALTKKSTASCGNKCHFCSHLVGVGGKASDSNDMNLVYPFF